LLGIQGWEVVPDGVRIEGERVVVAIRRRAGRGYRCGRCGTGVLFAYDHEPVRQIRDLPLWGRPCWLEVQLARVDCPCCGVTVEAVEWVEPYARQTLRYERYLAQLCGIMPVLDVAELEGVDKNTVYRVDRKWLARRAELRESRPVRHLGIDEIAIKKRHRYATVFYDLDRREVLGLVQHRSQRATSRFFRRWGKEQCRAVEAVCMDLWRPYLNSVRRYCRQAVVVFDKFHVYRYLAEAIEQVRRYEQAVADAPTGALIKGTRWLWLKAWRRLRGKKRYTLAAVMKLNRRLQRAYLLKEDFEAFSACADAEDGGQFLKGWLRRCQSSGLEPFRKLAHRIRRWAEGILAYFTHRLTNSMAEGINNKIKVLKRRSDGFHDEGYFFLKILHATGALPPLQLVGHPLF